MRVAVLLPHPYRGGTLKATQDLCRLLRDAGAEPVCGLMSDRYEREHLLPFRAAKIPLRALQWRAASPAEAAVIARQCGVFPEDLPPRPEWGIPDDGAGGFLDCRFWIVVSDRCHFHILPLRPYAVLAFDYIQRYAPEIFDAGAWERYERRFRPLAQDAWRVLVTTPETRRDCIDFAGVPARRARLLPPFYSPPASPPPAARTREGILWLCNPTPHKNHPVVLDGLRAYWSAGGTMRATMAGPMVEQFLDAGGEHMEKVRKRIRDLGAFSERLRITGELAAPAYWRAMASARLLLHGAKADNGTLAAAEAGLCGTPVVSSDYPQMRTIARAFGVEPAWFDRDDPDSLADRLLEAERSLAAPDPIAVRARLDAQWRAAVASIAELLQEAERDRPPLPSGSGAHG